MRWFYHPCRVVFAVLYACFTLMFARVAMADEPPAPHASGSSSTAAPAQAGEVRVRERVIVTVRAPRADRSASERARAANDAIAALLAHPEEIGEVRYEEQPQGAAIVYVGKTPIITFGPEDATASGEASASVLAAQVQTRLSDAMSTERKRSAIATTVFSFSLLIFSALIAFLILQRVSDLAGRIREWLVEDPAKITGVRLGKIEFVSAGAARGSLSIALTLGHRLTQLAIAYGWLIFALSLFESTRGYTQKLTGIMVTPLYALAARIGGALPMFVVAAIAAIAVTVLVRFVGLFFDSVAHGDTRIEWLPRDLARPTSTIIRGGIIVLALLLASPMITGDEDGALSRVGLVALVSLALAASPLLASAAVGTVVVYGRRLRRGELVEFGGRTGRVTDVTLFEVRLEDAAATDIGVPHLLGLVHPTRIHRHPPLGSVDVVVDASAPQGEVEKALLEAARELSTRAKVELVVLDHAGARWRVTSAVSRGDTTLARAVQEALAKLGVELGGAGASRGASPP